MRPHADDARWKLCASTEDELSDSIVQNGHESNESPEVEQTDSDL